MADTLTATHLRAEDGRIVHLDVRRWMTPADPVDEALLDRAVGPVLDVGCGPGRHVRALRSRGVEALGLDVSPTAVALARRWGARVLQHSVFEALPGHGPWRSALLLDGSVGIGGDPVALLARVGELLHHDGNVLVEAEGPGVASESMRVCLETRLRTSPWFAWARLAADDVAAVAARAGFAQAEAWEDGGRYFSSLVRSAS